MPGQHPRCNKSLLLLTDKFPTNQYHNTSSHHKGGNSHSQCRRAVPAPTPWSTHNNSVGVHSVYSGMEWYGSDDGNSFVAIQHFDTQRTAVLLAIMLL